MSLNNKLGFFPVLPAYPKQVDYQKQVLFFTVSSFISYRYVKLGWVRLGWFSSGNSHASFGELSNSKSQPISSVTKKQMKL